MTAESDTEVPVGGDDLRLLRALQLAPRASFATLGDVLGIHERTVSRRYRRLRGGGVVRVFGMVNPMTLGAQFWQIRVRCRPDSAEALATALAARDDIAWVAVAAGGAEVSCSVRSLSGAHRELLLTRLLPRSAHVLDVEASVVLHVFRGLSANGWSGLADRLTPAQTARLTASERGSGAAEPVPPEPYDQALFACLAVDGRATTAQLADAAGVSHSQAARRLARLIDARTLVIDVDLAYETLGYTTWAQLFLTVGPGHLHEVGTALARLPEVGFVAATSGRTNLVVSVACRDLVQLYAFTTDRIGPLDGVATLEIVPFGRAVKLSGSRVVDGRLSAHPSRAC